MLIRQITVVLTFSMAALLLVGLQPSQAALSPAGVESGEPATPWFPISTINTSYEDGDNYLPSVAFNSARNDYLVVWNHTDSSQISNSLYGRFLKDDGALVGDPFAIQGCSSNDNNAPDVVYNPARDEYLVVSHIHPPGSGICAARLTADGSLINNPVLIASDDGYGYSFAAAAFEPATAQYLITWQKYTSFTLSIIEAVSLKGDGTATSSIIPVTRPKAGDWLVNPDVACIRTVTGCLVVWTQQDIQTNSDHDVLAQRIQMQGGAHREGLPFAVAGSADDEVNPAVASVVLSRRLGQYLVAYNHEHDGTWSTVARTITDGGALEQFSWLSPSSGRPPAVAGSESRQTYLVVWPSLTNTSMPAVTVSTTGTVGAVQLASKGGVAPFSPMVAAGEWGSFLVVDDDRFAGYLTSDIFGYIWGQLLYLPVIKR